ncbi:DUF5063 domain-containing protein, partial [Streptomyces sp. NEAU-H3]|nr:DUF5063 domain-containing protein [Streptomyces sp. NEAU-H3]
MSETTSRPEAGAPLAQAVRADGSDPADFSTQIADQIESFLLAVTE